MPEGERCKLKEMRRLHAGTREVQVKGMRRVHTGREK
jgi:hypothetical protein